MTGPNPALEAAVSRLTSEERARLSRALGAATVAALNELTAVGRKRIAEREAKMVSASGEPEEPGPHDRLALPSQDADDAGHDPHL